MDEQLKTNWPLTLNQVARRLNPSHEEMLDPLRIDYYWSTYQSEWATDIMFKSPEALARIYPMLVRSGICLFGSTDVMRFLGRKLHPNFNGEVVSHFGTRPEGVRLKHQVKANSVKIYDKQGSVLRVETTLNDPSEFKVYRSKEGDPGGPLSWQPMRKGIADLNRRAEVSHASNQRYLEALASIKGDRTLGELVQSVCRTVSWNARPVRALRLWAKDDVDLLGAISRGEFNINGFRSRDIGSILFPNDYDCVIKRRIAARVTHRLRILRAHGIIRKVHRTHRYMLTKKGRLIATAAINIQQISVSRIMDLVA